MTASTRDPAATAERPSGEPVGPAAGGLGLALLCAALAVQAALGTMLLAGSPERNPARLSQWGRFLFYPEREVAVYLGTLGLALLGVGLLARRRAGAGSFTVEVLQSFAAAAMLGAWLVLFLRARTYAAAQEPVPAGFVIGFVTIGLLTLVAMAARRWLRVPDRLRRPRTTEMSSQAAAQPGISLWDLLVPAMILPTVYVPSYRQAAGLVFLEEGLLHWDHFAMGPALLFRHGQALGTEALNYYGAGWPMVFSALDPLIEISFGHMIQIGSAYLCLYLAGVYLLLRLVTGRPGFAAAGTALAAATLFYWMEGLYLWRAPNVTPLRWAFDVWCLIALVLHHRSGKPAWAGVAGAAAGLAVVFNFNAGIELGAATLFYWLCLARMPGTGAALRKSGLAFAGAAAGVAFAGLALAGRGQVFSGAFWRGWWSEPLSFLTLPLATGTRTSVLVTFVVMVFAYLGICGYALAAAVQRRATYLTVLSGTIALYGLLVQVKFLRHSSGMTFPRLLMPAAILLTILLSQLALRVGANAGRWRHAAAPAVVVALAGLVLLAPGSPVVDPVLDYPNLLSSAVRGAEPEEVCLMTEPRDLCGLPEAMSGSAQEFRDISARLATLSESGSVGVIDETGSLFYLASGTPPFGRYPRIFTTPYTTELLEQAVEPFKAHPPDYLLTRVAIPADSPELARWAGFGVGPRPDSPYADAWQALGSVVADHYVLEATVGPFELWRLAGLPAEP